MRALKVFLTGRGRLDNLKIELRLQLAFACVLLLMFAGTAISFWYFQRVRDRVAEISTAEQRVTAVLRVNNNLLTLMNRLSRAADNRNPEYFETEARRLLRRFESDTAAATGALRDIKPATGREKLVVDSLREVVETLPERLATMINLARDGDWIALHGRLANQVDHTDYVAEALIREAEANVSETQSRLFEEIDNAEHQGVQTLALTGMLSFLAAAVLGFVVTRSITKPLAALDAGARALARGDFEYQIALKGNNELAHLAGMFNRTARDLANLYGQLRNSEARFRSLIENASDLILLAGRSGELLYVSPSSDRVLGYSPDQLTGRSIRELVAPEEVPVAERLFPSVDAEASNTQRFELHFLHRDSSRRLMNGAVTNLLGDPAVGGVLINARDVSERRQAEEALKRSNEALQRANDDLSVFAYSASHDLQEPLRNLSLFSQMLQRKYQGQLDAQADEFIGHLTAGAARMSELVKDLLSYLEVSSARTQSALRSPVDAAIRKAVSNLQAAVHSNNATVHYDELPSVAVESVHLQQLFQNLISNAIKYRSAEVPEIRISAQEFNGYWCFSVKDNGIGISPQYSNFVFRLFKRLHGQSEYPGTGVGLAICQKIVERHGGRIWVESQPGQGSDFRFTLPRSDG